VTWYFFVASLFNSIPSPDLVGGITNGKKAMDLSNMGGLYCEIMS